MPHENDALRHDVLRERRCPTPMYGKVLIDCFHPDVVLQVPVVGIALVNFDEQTLAAITPAK